MEIETIPVELFTFDRFGGYYQAKASHLNSALPHGPHGGFPSVFALRMAGRMVEYHIEENLRNGVIYRAKDKGVAALAVIWNS